MTYLSIRTGLWQKLMILEFFTTSITPTIWCYHISNPLPFIKSVYKWVICELSRNGRVAWMIYVKISKKHLIGETKSKFLKEFIEYSEAMGANREKSKRGVRYTSYLSSLFDISWFGVNYMMKWMFWWSEKVDFDDPTLVYDQDHCSDHSNLIECSIYDQ